MSRSRISVLAICLFGLIVGARWALYYHYGTDLPHWDQWDAEGRAIFYPLSLGQLHLFPALWSPHNEHRVALTRFAAWAITELNGQWDQRLEAAINALLPATIAVTFLVVAFRRLSWRWIAGLATLLAAVYALPIAWQNTLEGFDSQQFFLIGLALGAVAWLPFARPFSRHWWAGALCVMLSLGSMGSGFFAGGVVGGMLVYQVLRGQRKWSSAVPGLVVCAAAIVIGVASRTIVPGHEGLKAHKAVDFLMATARALAWPAFDFYWGFSALLLCVPWAWLTWRTLVPLRRTPPRWEQFLSGAGLWVFFQVLATAYARGNGGPGPATRYIDTLVIGLIVNLLCLHALWQAEASISPRRAAVATLTGAWAFLCAVGLACVATIAFQQDLPPLVSYNYYCEQNVRNYLLTGDGAYLNHDEIPYPNGWALKEDLDYPGIARILPVSVRRPLNLEPAVGPDPSNAGFVRNDARVPEPLNRVPRQGAGISPATPVLSNAVTWGTFTSSGRSRSAQWSSRPLRTETGRWLRFETAGDIGRPGATLELHDAASGRLLAAVTPDKPAGDSWRTAMVHAPKGTFVVTARLDAPANWMAFSEPTEMSGGSYWAWRAVRHGGAIALVCGLAGIGVLAASRRSSA